MLCIPGVSFRMPLVRRGSLPCVPGVSFRVICRRRDGIACRTSPGFCLVCGSRGGVDYRASPGFGSQSRVGSVVLPRDLYSTPPGIGRVFLKW